eukprot:scaffold4097_cov166-Amphora_coffeaeformis.AAC.48
MGTRSKREMTSQRLVIAELRVALDPKIEVTSSECVFASLFFHINGSQVCNGRGRRIPKDRARNPNREMENKTRIFSSQLVNSAGTSFVWPFDPLP